jgi:hypothetical protein
MNAGNLEEQILAVELELSAIAIRREALQSKLLKLRHAKNQLGNNEQLIPGASQSLITGSSSTCEKITLFRSLFRGREDVFSRRFESKKTGRSGYQPVCKNEWERGICRKPAQKCITCDNREFIPVSDEIIRKHLLGYDPDYKRE